MIEIKFIKGEKKYIQIYKYLRNLIEQGSILKGNKLPATRELAEQLRVGRSTVIRAYEELEFKGYAEILKGKGTFATGLHNKDSENCPQPFEAFNWSERTSNLAKKAVQLDVMKWDSQYKKGMISFKSIAPDGKTFDLEGFKRSFYNRISAEGSNILNYGYARGYDKLIQWLFDYMRAKGIDTEGKDIIITNGFTEGLNLILDAFLERGDKILCENPTHNTAIKIFKIKGLDIVGVPIRGNGGFDITEFESLIDKSDIKAIFLIPSYHNPTGTVMGLEKRRQVYEIASSKGIPIIEDWFAEELNYTGDHIKSISAICGRNNDVINIGSFSKILFPGLRIGWVFGDKSLIDNIESIKRTMNIHTSFLDQGILYEYLNGEDVDKFIKRIRKSYKERFENTCKYVKEYIPKGEILGEGGLYVYVVIDNEINVRELLERCIKRGVIFTCGDVFDIGYDGKSDITKVNDKSGNTLNGFRLGLSRLDKVDIKNGIKVIGEEIDKMYLNN